MNLNYRAKDFLLAIILIFIGMKVNAQYENFSSSITVGATTSILDNGVGLHLGYNPSYALTSNFSIESQVSYLYTKISSTFISGNTGKNNAINALLGGRLYFMPAEKSTRIYINALFGANYNKEEINNVKSKSEIIGGFSLGAFIEIKKLLFGLSIESPSNLTLKFGMNI